MIEQTPAEVAELELATVIENYLHEGTEVLGSELAFNLAKRICEQLHISFDYESSEINRIGDDHPRTIWRRWLVMKSPKRLVANEDFEDRDD